MSSDSSILIETANRVGLIRLNRPQSLNALNSQLLQMLMDTLEHFNQDPTIGAMVITGSDRAFAAGVEIGEMAQATTVDMLLSDLITHFDRIRQIELDLDPILQRQPVILVGRWLLHDRQRTR